MEIRFNHAARSALMSGIDKLADTVKGTLGPRGATWPFTRSRICAAQTFPTAAAPELMYLLQTTA